MSEKKLVIKPVSPEDLDSIESLVRRTSEQDIYPLFSAEGRKTFNNSILKDTQTIFDTDRFYTVKAIENNRIVGVAALRDKNYMTTLFVDKNSQSKGVGKALLNHVLDHLEGDSLSLRASINAVGFYQHHGFEATGPEGNVNGVRFLPMTLK
ncbi:GNAT family N-acetyltransferase [Endozoicomonas arenosclerae]|uniref:GNAT family N-acetyltransferase n=1 Tax=Endozoicomonas arenosclerae TaxID=1633495 RepID=UPI000782495B|nr:GNAT family N-acetyltransferase [Endozoicomonas arenosclerae]